LCYILHYENYNSYHTQFMRSLKITYDTKNKKNPQTTSLKFILDYIFTQYERFNII